MSPADTGVLAPTRLAHPAIVHIETFEDVPFG
jgi:hypothetical protein